MRKMNRFIPVALACAIFAAQPVQAATIIRDSDKQATSQNKQTTNTTQNPQAGNEGGPGYEDSKPNTSNNTTNTTGQSQVSAEAKAAADAIAKPTISAEAGILYDVTNGRVLFEKNADEKLAPASTTKLMTALLVLEKANLDDKVTFSKTAVTNLESGAVKIGLVEGDQVSVKDSLYALLLKSAKRTRGACLRQYFRLRGAHERESGGARLYEHTFRESKRLKLRSAVYYMPRYGEDRSCGLRK